MVGNHTGGKRPTAAMWASGTVWDLPRLARLVGLPTSAIEALMFMPDLRAATGQTDIGIRALGDDLALLLSKY
jgi:hypothetical protein